MGAGWWACRRRRPPALEAPEPEEWYSWSEDLGVVGLARNPQENEPSGGVHIIITVSESGSGDGTCETVLARRVLGLLIVA